MHTKQYLSDRTTVSKENDRYVYNLNYPEDLFQNQDFITLIGEIQERSRITLDYYNYPIPEIRDLIDQIDDEIKE